jgi:hypothetical protein
MKFIDIIKLTPQQVGQLKFINHDLYVRIRSTRTQYSDVQFAIKMYYTY